jgi:hypothetical protein
MMNIHLPHILANVSGSMIIIFGLVYIVVTFNTRGVGPTGALFFLIAGLAIVAVGVMNIVLAYGNIGQRSTIPANIILLVLFAAATYLTMAPSAIVGLILFGIASVCSTFVLRSGGRPRRIYPHRL